MGVNCRPPVPSRQFQKGTPPASAAASADIVNLVERLGARQTSLAKIVGPSICDGAIAIEAAFTKAATLLVECGEAGELGPDLFNSLVGKLEALALAHTNLCGAAIRAMKPETAFIFGSSAASHE